MVDLGRRMPPVPLADYYSLDVTAADARGASAFSTLLLVGALLLIAGFIVGRKATRAAESEPLLATTA